MSRIITFYSYKGGVGRTAALANIGVLLARRGKRVLLVDWDLEAPGLDRYFQPYIGHPQPPNRGLIYLLHEAAQSPSVEWESHKTEVVLPPISDTDPEPPRLDLISSGSVTEDYADRVRTFSWREFFEQQSGGEFLERLRDEWKGKYHFVLIDSRTGITDSGGVCTILLPDFLALVFLANDQSFEGALAITKAAQAARRHLDVLRPPLMVLPIPGRFDRTDEVDEADQWLERFSVELTPFYDDWLPERFKPLQILELTKIPYVTRFSFGEKLPVLTHGTSDPTLPGYYYHNLQRLLESDFRDAAPIIDPQSVKTPERLFISHSTRDDAFVGKLRKTLALHGIEGWIDSRELRGGDLLWLEIQYAIDDASAYAIVISPDGLQSKWVGNELEHALQVQRRRGKDEHGKPRFPVIPLLLDGTKLGAFRKLFDGEPAYIAISSAPGGVEAAMNALLVALGKRLPADTSLPSSQPQSQVPDEPMEELVLELTDLDILDRDGIRRARARARLIHEPATPGKPPVYSAQPWRFTAPLGPIEAGELRWYLEQYALWPSHYFRERAGKVEANLREWGQLLYNAALPPAHTGNVLRSWENIDSAARRRFSVHVDDAPLADAEADTPPSSAATPQNTSAPNTTGEAAALLLGLPWELLHDGKRYLFQGPRPTRVRRRLPNTEGSLVPVFAPPIRILLITARPEDTACAYLDHRVSALPLVQAMESLPGLVQIEILTPPTLPELARALEGARAAGAPYHVVHFDGHGVYDRKVGLGGLCFEHPQDTAKLEHRRHITITTNELGPLLRNHHIPLVFLEAAQSAQAEQASESVASALLKVGIASVVAMSHGVLVETARRFVAAFYGALAGGKRVGDAMLAGQGELANDDLRGHVFGSGEFRLADWFVPVLFQDREDPRLFTAVPSRQTREDFRAEIEARLGDTPTEPETGFVGRSRELLALERLLGVPTQARGNQEVSYAVIRGQGGEGKTALATEFTRWQVRAQRVARAAFVSVEGLEANLVESVLDKLGAQLLRTKFSTKADCGGDLEQATQRIEHALREQSTLLILDNMESILPPPFLVSGSASGSAARKSRFFIPHPEEPPWRTALPEEPRLPSGAPRRKKPQGSHDPLSGALREEARRELESLLALCQRLLKITGTRLVFTSREALPAPFDGARNRQELAQLARADAVKLVERVVSSEGAAPATASAANDAVAAKDAALEQIEQLVDAVHCHARTLALLAPAIRQRGVIATRRDLEALMGEMERRFPGHREQSVFAGVELSLQRLSPANRARVGVLAVFHGGVDLEVLRVMMEWEQADVDSLASELVATGLATPNRYNHLTLNPALGPYLRVTCVAGVERPGREPPATTTHEQTGGLASLGPQPPNTQTPEPPPPTPDELLPRWRAAMTQYVAFLVQQQNLDTEMATTLTRLELPNLFVLLALVQNAGDSEKTIDLATDLYHLLHVLGKPRSLERVGAVRDAAERELASTQGGGWGHARFEAARTRVEQQLAGGQLPAALAGAQALLERARTAGKAAYPGADYDLAIARILLARVLKEAGGAGQALVLLEEARQGFEVTAKTRDSKAAEGMATVCFAEQGNCLLVLGRLEEAGLAYEENIRRAEKLSDERQVAVGKAQLGSVRLYQDRYREALGIYEEARARFTQLGEEGTVAGIWHQTGRAYQQMGEGEAAEVAYRQALAIWVRLGDSAGQAATLGQLGNLYDDVLNRPEEAVTFLRQAADKYIGIGNVAGEGRQRNNLAIRLRKLGRLDAARREIRRAIQCKEGFGHAAEPWKSWDILADIESDACNPAAARQAKTQARDAYLAYRRDGGENHSGAGRLALAVAQGLAKGQTAEAAALLQEQLPRFEAAGFGGFIRALQAIVAGGREPSLADDPELSYSMAAEILLLVEEESLKGEV